MEKKKVDVGEALSYMFRGENFLKLFCGVVILGIPIVLYLFVLGSIMFMQNIDGLKLIGVSVLQILMVVCLFILNGYISLYMHDRALDKNAKFRDWSEATWDALLAQIKLNYGLKIIFTILNIAFFIPIFILVFIPVLGWILGFGLCIAVVVVDIRVFFTIMPFFAKDLKFSSLFKWREAFSFCKGVHYGAGAILMFLAMIVSLIIFPILYFFLILYVTHSPHTNNSIYIIMLIMPILMPFFYLYIRLFCANIFGQFSYNAIELEQSLRERPIRLSKEINKDTIAVTVCSVIFAISTIYGATSLVPKLMEIKEPTNNVQHLRNNIGTNSNSSLKIKKAIVNYEMAAATYMAEYEKSNIRDLTTNNCANIGKYFHIEQQNGCDFKTTDGVYWQFNNDGSATISDSVFNPQTSIKVGVCSNGSINCESEYPDVHEFTRGR